MKCRLFSYQVTPVFDASVVTGVAAKISIVGTEPSKKFVAYILYVTVLQPWKKKKKKRNDKVGQNIQDCDLVSSSARFRSSVNFGSLVSSLQSALAEYCEFQTSRLSW